MIRLVVYDAAGPGLEWLWVAPRSVASVLETEREPVKPTPGSPREVVHEFDSSRTCDHCGIAADRVPGIAEKEFCAARAAKVSEPVLVAVLKMWDGSEHVVLDPQRKVVAMIQEAQQQTSRPMPAMVTKRKPLV